VVDGQVQILFASVVAVCYYSQVCNCVPAAISGRAPAFQSVQAFHFFQQAAVSKLLVTLSPAAFPFLPACSLAAARAAFFHSAQALLLVEVRAANCHPAHFYSPVVTLFAASILHIHFQKFCQAELPQAVSDYKHADSYS
jgi:hypothetical protein